ncbi:MAG: hypothetical protein LBS42_10400 [Tannerella sp.]|jgi:hypothetical protein|nr:hypothetical protein [Tannerella sp.]
MERSKNFEEFLGEALQLKKLSCIAGGIETDENYPDDFGFPDPESSFLEGEETGIEPSNHLNMESCVHRKTNHHRIVE